MAPGIYSGRKILRRARFVGDVSAWRFQRGRFGVQVSAWRFRRGRFGDVKMSCSGASHCLVGRDTLSLWGTHVVSLGNRHCLFGKHTFSLWRTNIVSLQNRHCLFGEHTSSLWRTDIVSLENRHCLFGEHTLSLWERHNVCCGKRGHVQIIFLIALYTGLYSSSHMYLKVFYQFSRKNNSFDRHLMAGLYG